MIELTLHNAIGLTVGLLLIGLIVGLEWAAHMAADRRDVVPLDDHVDQAWEVIGKTVIP